MGWNGSGNFIRDNGSATGATIAQTDFATGANQISPVHWDNELNTIAQGLENCLTKDSQTLPSQPLNLNSKTIINLANGVNANDGVNKSQLDLKVDKTPTANINANNYKVVNLANGTAAGDAVNKGQLDTKLNLAGGTLTGSVNVNGYYLTNIANAINTGDAVNKGLLDAVSNAKANLSGATFTGSLLPNASQAYNLGGGSNRWNQIFANKGEVCRQDAPANGECLILAFTVGGTSTRRYLDCFDNYGNGGQNKQFNLQGDGYGYADGGWSGGGADYAEYFQYLGVLEYGDSVTLENGRVRKATEGEAVIGVVRPKDAACIVGNNGLNWAGKYKRDPFGQYVLSDSGERILSPDFDPNRPYIPRSERPGEWVLIGLLGQIPTKKTAIRDPRWVLIRELSAEVDLILVR